MNGVGLLWRAKKAWREGEYEIAARCLECVAKENKTGEALFLLSECHAFGFLNFKICPTKAKGCLSGAVDLKNGWAMFQYANRLKVNGTVVASTTTKKTQYYKKAFDSGDPYVMALCYLDGICVKKSARMATRCLKSSNYGCDLRGNKVCDNTRHESCCAFDNMCAEYQMGEWYIQNLDAHDPRTLNIARDWFFRAAQRGHSFAQHRVAELTQVEVECRNFTSDIWNRLEEIWHEIWNDYKKAARQGNICSKEKLQTEPFAYFERRATARRAAFCFACICKFKRKTLPIYIKQLPKDIAKIIIAEILTNDELPPIL